MFDLVDDVVVELGSRTARALLMVVAVGLSSGSLLASVGISMSAGQQIEADIAASTLDVVTAQVVPPTTAAAAVVADDTGPGRIVTILPEDTDERVARHDLVDAAGRRLDVSGSATAEVTRTAVRPDPATAGARAAVTPVVGVSAGYLDAARAQVSTDMQWLLDTDEDVVLLGRGAARALDVPLTGNLTGVQVWLNGEPQDVVGLVSGGTGGLEDAVLLPYRRGLELVGNDREAAVLVRTLPGAGAPVADVLAVTLRPDAPERLDISRVASVDTLRTGVATQLDRLAAWMGTVLTALTILLIANSMVVAVTARTAEIGLRRALGFSRGRVAQVFLAEGSLIGLLGGLVGSAFAAGSVVLICLANGWSVLLSPWLVVLGPVVGAGVGLAASMYPASRAARISPALAVRSD
ncbi:ABC transporter permease [Actinotalea fermentans ATCC 43279 = JCM 9966 = DSM 3133]|nr:ABC transporter permease [Actinotalea fermentans ATCC 43279 = JCM 9966 = DSM 3133]